MKFSVFSYLMEEDRPESRAFFDTSLSSLVNQTYTDFKWTIFLKNNDSEELHNYIIQQLKEKNVAHSIILLAKDHVPDSHFKHQQYEGDLLLELKNGDVLHPDCLSEIKLKAEEHYNNSSSDNVFIYSDACLENPEDEKKYFPSQFGWNTYNSSDYNKKTLIVEATPLNFSWPQYLWLGTVAWPKAFFSFLQTLPSAINLKSREEFLMLSYIHGKPLKVSKPLYSTSCAYFQILNFETCAALHTAYALPSCEKWCDEKGKIKVDLCCGKNKLENYVGVDLTKRKGVDIVRDLNESWPFEDNSVGLFFAQEAVEYLKDPLHVMKEMYRCLAPHGWAMIYVPSTDGRGAFQNPLYKSYWNANSFYYYTRHDHSLYINTPVKFQLNHLTTWLPSEFHEKNNIPYTAAHLVKHKDDVIPYGGRII